MTRCPRLAYRYVEAQAAIEVGDPEALKEAVLEDVRLRKDPVPKRLLVRGWETRSAT